MKELTIKYLIAALIAGAIVGFATLISLFYPVGYLGLIFMFFLGIILYDWLITGV